MAKEHLKFNATKYYFMTVAEVLDAYRTVPRLLVLGYSYLVWDTINWFQMLTEATSQHTFLVSTVVGGAAAVFGLYVNSGATWDKKSTSKHHFIETTNNGSTYDTRQPELSRQLPTRNLRQSTTAPGPRYHQTRNNPVMELETQPNRMEVPPAEFFDN